MEWLRSALLPPQGSDWAKEIDVAYMAILWLSIAFFGPSF